MTFDHKYIRQFDHKSIVTYVCKFIELNGYKFITSH